MTEQNQPTEQPISLDDLKPVVRAEVVRIAGDDPKAQTEAIAKVLEHAERQRAVYAELQRSNPLAAATFVLDHRHELYPAEMRFRTREGGIRR